MILKKLVIHFNAIICVICVHPQLKNSMKTKFKLFTIFTFALFALVFFVPKGEMQTKQVETAGEKFKNIKVLNDMPADQMGKVMNMMSASFGRELRFLPRFE